MLLENVHLKYESAFLVCEQNRERERDVSKDNQPKNLDPICLIMGFNRSACHLGLTDFTQCGSCCGRGLLLIDFFLSSKVE